MVYFILAATAIVAKYAVPAEAESQSGITADFFDDSGFGCLSGNSSRPLLLKFRAACTIPPYLSVSGEICEEDEPLGRKFQ